MTRLRRDWQAVCANTRRHAVDTDTRTPAEQAAYEQAVAERSAR